MFDGRWLNKNSKWFALELLGYFILAALCPEYASDIIPRNKALSDGFAVFSLPPKHRIWKYEDKDTGALVEGGAMYRDGVEVAAISAIMRVGGSGNQRTMENVWSFRRRATAGWVRWLGRRNFNTSAATAGILHKGLRRFHTNHYYKVPVILLPGADVPGEYLFSLTTRRLRSDFIHRDWKFPIF